MTITNSVIENNTSLDDGGGILAQPPGKLSVINSSIIGNNSDEGDGGGIAAETTFNLVNDTLFGNRSGQNGGAILAQANGKIGSLTIDGNHSVQSNGGGIDIASGSVKITNTIIALNTAPMEFAQDCGGSFVSQGFNLIFDTTGCTVSGKTESNITGEDPNLGAPEPFDVQSRARAESGSPVLGAGGHCLKTDERSAPAPEEPLRHRRVRVALSRSNGANARDAPRDRCLLQRLRSVPDLQSQAHLEQRGRVRVGAASCSHIGARCKSSCFLPWSCAIVTVSGTLSVVPSSVQVTSMVYTRAVLILPHRSAATWYRVVTGSTSSPGCPRDRHVTEDPIVASGALCPSRIRSHRLQPPVSWLELMHGYL